MKVEVTAFYTKPKLVLNVSYKVYQALDKYINATIKKAGKKIKIEPSDLWIILDTGKIRTTKIGKKIRFGTGKAKFKISVILPYDPLIKSKHFLSDFVNLVCEAVIEILATLQVPREYLLKMKEECLKEIPDNPKYEFNDEIL